MTHPTGRWRKSSRSGQGQSNNCVEARLFDGHPQLSDSQHGGTRPIMDLSHDDYLDLVRAITSETTV